MWGFWPAERVLYVFIGVVFLAIFVQVTLFHLRQNFRHPAMWLPVILTPLLGVIALLLSWQNVALLRMLFVWGAAAGVGIGLIGGYLHTVGVGERVNGYTLGNFMVGPPVVLPVMVTVMSVLSLFVLYAF